MSIKVFTADIGLTASDGGKGCPFNIPKAFWVAEGEVIQSLLIPIEYADRFEVDGHFVDGILKPKALGEG